MARHPIDDQRSSRTSAVLTLHAAMDPFVLAQSQHHEELRVALAAQKEVHKAPCFEVERTAQQLRGQIAPYLEGRV